MRRKRSSRAGGAAVAREWSAAMKAGRDGAVRDFVCAGDVEIRAIGADNPAPSSPLHTTANRTLPVRSQFLPTASKIFIKISARKGMDRSMDTPQGDPVSGWNGVNSTGAPGPGGAGPFSAHGARGLGTAGDGGPLQLAVDDLVILHHHVPGLHHLQGVILVQAQNLPRGHRDVIVNGDGNGNPAKVSSVAQAGKLTYEDLVAFWNDFEPYQLNALLVGTWRPRRSWHSRKWW